MEYVFLTVVAVFTVRLLWVTAAEIVTGLTNGDL
jgi:hypothetical protein